MQGLNRLLAKPSHLTVLRTLYEADEPLSGRETERRCGLASRTVMLALEALHEMAAVTCTHEGTSYLYTINRENYFVAKAVVPALERETEFWEDVRKLVRRRLQPRPLGAVATGQLARDEALAEGTIELVMVFTTARKRIQAFRNMEKLEQILWNRYGVPFGYTLLDLNTMEDEEYESLWRRVAREGILLFGEIP